MSESSNTNADLIKQRHLDEFTKLLDVDEAVRSYKKAMSLDIEHILEIDPSVDDDETDTIVLNRLMNNIEQYSSWPISNPFQRRAITFTLLAALGTMARLQERASRPSSF